METTEVEVSGILLAESLYTREHFMLLSTLVRQLEDMQYGTTNSDIDDVFMDPDMEDSHVQSAVVEMIIKRDVHAALALIGIELNNEITLVDCKKLLDAVSLLPYLEDPIPYLRMLESSMDTDEEVLCKLLEEMTGVGMDNWMRYIDELSPSLIDRIKAVLEGQETKVAPEDEQVELSPEYVAQLKDYATFYGKESIGYQIATSGVVLCMPLEVYLSYFRDEIQEDQPDVYAKHLLGLLLIAEDTWENPLEGFRRESENLVKAPEMIRRVEQSLMKLLNDFNQFRRAKHDASAIPDIQS